MISIVLAGDVMLGRGVNETLPDISPAEPWGDTLPAWTEADIRLINLECAITASRRPWTQTPKVFHFRADPAAVAVLQAAQIQACSLANNHTLDFEVEGLLDTLDHLDQAGIAHAGAGRTPEEAWQPAWVTLTRPEPLRLALLAITDNEPPFAARPDRPGTNYLPASLEKPVLRQIETAIRSAREAGADLVVFSNHCGPNMVEEPPLIVQRFARAVIDRGADIYFGHSAHIFQGVEVYRDRLILYDTGDFLDDYAVDPELRNDWSFLFRVACDRAVPRRLELLPVKLTFAQVHFATGEERDQILARMKRLSARLGTELLERDGSLQVELAGRE